MHLRYAESINSSALVTCQPVQAQCVMPIHGNRKWFGLPAWPYVPVVLSCRLFGPVICLHHICTTCHADEEQIFRPVCIVLWTP